MGLVNGIIGRENTLQSNPIYWMNTNDFNSIKMCVRRRIGVHSMHSFWRNISASVDICSL